MKGSTKQCHGIVFFTRVISESGREPFRKNAVLEIQGQKRNWTR